MGENEASLPNTSLQGKCQQPLKCFQSENQAVSITEFVCVYMRAHVSLCVPAEFQGVLEGEEK